MMLTWTEKTVAVNSLKPYERNPRKIAPADYARLKASIEEMGYHQRCVAQPDGRLIGGHQRLKVFNELGIDQIQILIPSRELTEAEYRRMLIQDNLPFGEFNVAMLSTDFTLPELEEWGMDTSILETNADYSGLTDPDATPTAPPAPITLYGDLWRLGDHRLMCGDSTKAEDVGKLLAGAQPMLMVTDPPYGVNYDADWRNEAMPTKNNPFRYRDGKGRAIGAVMNDDRADWSEAWALFPGNIAYIWHGSLQTDIVKNSIEKHSFKMRALIVWAKSHFAIGRGDYHGQHEPCWYAVKGKGNWCGDRKQTTLWQIDKPQKSETGHSTQKPVECMKRPIENNSKPGDFVYEPFCGSGTTIIAGEMTGRKVLACEIAPQYVDVAVIRWEQFTGKSAIHAETGDTFLQVSQARQAAAGGVAGDGGAAGDAPRPPRRTAKGG